MTDSSLRQHVYYTGHVQGVGFRYTTSSLARNYAVEGWVRNLPDGRVELVVEGDPSEVKRFLGAVGKRMADNIHHSSVADERPTGLEAGFQIK